MSFNSTVAVYGAYGHTGRFVVAELRRRGLHPVLCGRDPAHLRALADEQPGTPTRHAPLESPEALDRALAGVSAVVNCAGPFGDTPPAVVDAACRAGAHYIDVAGEMLVARRMFSDCLPPAGLVVLPATGFFGGLGDLLATVAYGDWPRADDVTVAVALDSWAPTAGSVRTGELRAGRRLVFAGGELRLLSGEVPPPSGTWTFPPPFGARNVEVEFPTADVVTIPRHLPTQDIHTYLYSPPSTTDVASRSGQRFQVEVVVRNGGQERRARASGRDIYASSAALAAEATSRVLRGQAKKDGLVALGEAFDAADFLEAAGLRSTTC